MANPSAKQQLPAICRRTLLVAMIAWQIPSTASAQSSVVDEIVTAINQDSLLQTVRILSGEEAAVTPDSTYWITTRWYENNDGALQFIRHRLQSYGYSTSLQSFEQGTNAIGVRIGTSQPDRFVIICAHYDAVRGTPGADDNASGTAGVLEAARVLAPYTFASTVVFALWDAEEQGLFGSAHYAAAASASDTDITAVINLDMVGWDGDNDSVLEVHTDISSAGLADVVAGYAQTYGLDLAVTVEQPGTSASDHASFWRNGYQAVLLIEELRGGDFNPYYHQPTDLIQHFDAAFFRESVALATAGTAELAGITSVGQNSAGPGSPEQITLRTYPAPFSTALTVQYEVRTPGIVRVTAYDLLGRQIATLVDGWHSPGRHVKRWSPAGQSSGVYFLSLETSSGRQTVPVVRTL